MTRSSLLSAHFIEGSAGRLFVVVRRPRDATTCPAILVVPAFGDEMNKTRRMVTETAKRLNATGLSAIVPDLYGTGDSEGELAGASWQQWCDDLRCVIGWAAREGLPVVGLLGIRTGALLATEIESGPQRLRGCVFWQPVASGRAFINQTLRIRVMSNSVNKGVRESTESLLERIASGEIVRVGGYDLSRSVVDPMLDMTLDERVSPDLGTLHIVDVIRTDANAGSVNANLGSVTATRLTLIGEPYWSSTEIVCNERVVESTVDHLSGCCTDA